MFADSVLVRPHQSWRHRAGRDYEGFRDEGAEEKRQNKCDDDGFNRFTHALNLFLRSFSVFFPIGRVCCSGGHHGLEMEFQVFRNLPLALKSVLSIATSTNS